MVTITAKITAEAAAVLDQQASKANMTRSSYLASMVVSQNQMADLADSVLMLARVARATASMVSDLYVERFGAEAETRIEDIKKEVGLL